MKNKNSAVFIVAAGLSVFLSYLVSDLLFAEESKISLKGRGKELCLTCHEKEAALLMREFQHTPVRNNDCFGCHDPHTSDHKGLVREQGAALCYGCHESEKRNFAQGNIHSPIRTSGCKDCHEPHASDFKNQLLSEYSELCFKCHAVESDKLKKAFAHQPFARKECGKCHSAHASSNEFLLEKDLLTTCFKCHNSAQGSFIKSHSGFDVRKSDCEGCHTSHASDSAGLIHQYQHQSFKDRECSTCHTMGQPDAGKLVSSPAELCTMCHEDTVKKQPPVFMHAVDTGKGCSSCHTSHASAFPHLFEKREWTTCLTCHSAIAGRFSKNRFYHPAKVEEGRCSICHSMHSGKDRNLMVEEPSKVCNRCHGQHFKFSHPMGKGVKDAWHERDEVTCLSCHDPHGTNHKAFLLLDPSRELCIQCHKIK